MGDNRLAHLPNVTLSPSHVAFQSFPRSKLWNGSENAYALSRDGLIEHLEVHVVELSVWIEGWRDSWARFYLNSWIRINVLRVVLIDVVNRTPISLILSWILGSWHCVWVWTGDLVKISFVAWVSPLIVSWWHGFWLKNLVQDYNLFKVNPFK